MSGYHRKPLRLEDWAGTLEEPIFSKPTTEQRPYYDPHGQDAPDAPLPDDRCPESGEPLVIPVGRVDLLAIKRQETRELREALKAIRDEADVIAHDEPDRWAAVRKLDEIWRLANDALEGDSA